MLFGKPWWANLFRFILLYLPYASAFHKIVNSSKKINKPIIVLVIRNSLFTLVRFLWSFHLWDSTFKEITWCYLIPTPFKTRKVKMHGVSKLILSTFSFFLQKNVMKHIGQSIQKWIKKICGRQPLENMKWHGLFITSHFSHKCYLVHSWIHCFKYR